MGRGRGNGRFYEFLKISDKMLKKKLSKRKIKKIRKLYAKGYSVADIVRIAKVSTGSVYNHAIYKKYEVIKEK